MIVRLLALLASRLAKVEVALKRVEAKQLGGADAVLVLPLGRGRFCGAGVIARFFARLGNLYGAPADAYVGTEVDHWLEQVDKYADPHVQKVRAPQQRAPAALPADRRSACGVRVRGL